MTPSHAPSASIAPSAVPSTEPSDRFAAPSFIPSLSPPPPVPTFDACTVVPDYDPNTPTRMASDGASVAFLIASQYIRVYTYDTARARWRVVGGELRVTELELQFDVASGGTPLVVGGLSPTIAYQYSPTCPETWRHTKLSIAFSDISLQALRSVSWNMQSVKLVGDIVVPTSNVNKSCAGCYDDYDKFAMTLISEEACLPASECLVVDYHAPMGFDDGFGMVLFDEDKTVAIHGNSSDAIQVFSKNDGEVNCTIPSLECNSTERHILVSLILDGHPEQTSWYLTKNKSMLGQFGKYEYGTHTHQLCVPGASDDSCLALTIQDTASNGFCCDTGVGQYFIWLDGELILNKTSDFEQSERIYFGGKGVDCSGVEVVHPVGGTLTVEMSLDEENDNAATTYWVLQEQSGIVIAQGGEQPKPLLSNGTLVRPNATLVSTNGTLVNTNGTLVGTNGTLIKSNGTMTSNGTAANVTNGGQFSFPASTGATDISELFGNTTAATNTTLNMTNFTLHPGTIYELVIVSSRPYVLESLGHVLIVGNGSSAANETIQQHNFTAPSAPLVEQRKNDTLFNESVLRN